MNYVPTGKDRTLKTEKHNVRMVELCWIDFLWCYYNNCLTISKSLIKNTPIHDSIIFPGDLKSNSSLSFPPVGCKTKLLTWWCQESLHTVLQEGKFHFLDCPEGNGHGDCISLPCLLKDVGRLHGGPWGRRVELSVNVATEQEAVSTWLCLQYPDPLFTAAQRRAGPRPPVTVSKVTRSCLWMKFPRAACSVHRAENRKDRYIVGHLANGWLHPREHGHELGNSLPSWWEHLSLRSTWVGGLSGSALRGEVDYDACL